MEGTLGEPVASRCLFASATLAPGRRRLAGLAVRRTYVRPPRVLEANSPPAAPSSVTLTRADGTVTASWDTVTGATKYHVTYSSDGENSWTSASDNHTETSITITDADNSKPYVVGVRAGNVNGWSGWRNSAAIASNIPDAPADVTVTRADGTVTASWDTVTGATKYHVTYSSDGESSWTSASDNHTETSITITDADNSKPYVVGVRAGNVNGWSGWRNSAAIASLLPATPDSVAISRTDGSVTATWPAVTGATGYQVNYSSDGMQSWRVATMNTATTSIAIIGVDNANTYVVGVRARNAYGVSNWTNSDSIAPLTPPAPPTAVTLARAPGQLTVTWAASTGATSYNINLTADGGWNWTRAVSGATGSGDTISNTITSNIVNGSSYIAGVQAVNDKGAGGWTNSDSIAPLTPPGPAQNLSASRSGTGISVSWDAPASNGGVAVTGYDVNYTTDDGNSWTRYASNQSETSATIANVSNAVEYIVAVRANNSVGEGPWQNFAAVVPLALTVSNVTTTTATLNFPNYPSTWHYQANAAPDNTCQGPVSGATRNVSGLNAGTTYTYTAYSDSSCATVLDAAPAFTVGSASVSNLSQTAHHQAMPIGSTPLATAFTTGSASGGYALQSVTVDMEAPTGGSPVLVMEVRAAYGGNPGSTLTTLSGANPTTAGQYTYTCSTNCALYRNATYFLVLRATNVTGTRYHEWRATTSDAETADPAGSGWSIGNVAKDWSTSEGWVNLPSSKSGKFRVTAVAGAGLRVPQINPGAPASVTPSRSGSGLAVSWTEPSVNGGSAGPVVTDYDVNYTTDGGRSWTRAVSAATGTSATISNADNALDYVVAVRANNAVGAGPWKNSATIAHLAGPASVAAYKGDGKGLGFIDVGWAAVAGATGYDVNYIHLGLHHSRAATNVTGTSFRININTGIYQMPHHFTAAVRARNAHGPGRWTNSPPAQVKRTLAVSGVTNTTATLTIGHHSAAWHYKATSGPHTTCQGPVASGTLIKDISGLAPATTYTYSAYSDGTCSDSGKLVTASAFTTGGVSASNLGVGGNTGQEGCIIGTLNGHRYECAAPFTAGSATKAPNGYTVDSVTVRIHDRTAQDKDPGDIRVELRASAGGKPASTALATLSGSNPTGAGEFTFTCAGASCALSPGATYWLHLAAPNSPISGSYSYLYYGETTSSDNQTLTPSGNEWEIGNASKYRGVTSGAWCTGWCDLSSSETLMFSVNATVDPVLKATSVTTTTATLTIANHSEAWWYKRTDPTGDDTCHSVTAGTDNDALSSLTANTSYTYKAYDKTGCNSADEIASVTFTTPSS